MSLPAHARDPHSYANADEVSVRHLMLDLTVDFEARQLRGFADLQLQWHRQEARTLWLDTRDLVIERVWVVRSDGAWQPATFRLGATHALYGQGLSVALPGQPQKVRIEYHSLPQASGLQWLPAELTASGRYPFLFSQSQAIHARSWVPIQDAPAVRFTYDAHIRTPAGILARMSASNDPQDQATGDYRFSMTQPIPAYLLAIAAGELAFKPLGPRSGIYAEPALLDAAADEFVDTERMIDVAESLYGPYRWGRYDLLVLPASFPFGGMENPRLTFLTPTVIAGDRSLVSLIAHELAHSWSGNLVTNSDWNHFWLNEGFTSYVENRLVEALFGSRQADMERVLSERSLALELPELAPADQSLVLDLADRDPDDGMNAVAYDKGHWLLRTMEQRYGRPAFDPFLRGWFDRGAFASANTEDFVQYWRQTLLRERPDRFSEAEMQQWLHQPGVPAHAQSAQSAAFDAVDAARAAWLQDPTTKLPTGDWSTHEWLRFLDGLPDDLPNARMAELDQAFGLSGHGNAEIAFQWYVKAIRSGYVAARPSLADFLQRIGRRKFVLPLYQELAKRGGDDLVFARSTYATARAHYHPITRSSVDPVLN
ncbi:MAG: M1 family metallopeptidase [Xanthomonadales bacterium]|nr:M1 family metallopeptidase [Xanthomonadales bacterium]MCB1641021.1 M1 family metallopeptidase [Xanthomonadales bacterium]